MSTRKIKAWHEAGLIDAETRARLVAYEHEHARPLALWAVYGIGALAIGLGLISVVAANWEDIPGQIRLAVHLLLIAATLGGLVWQRDGLAETAPWALEALLFVAALLGLTFFGHIGQVYQTNSPLWQPIAGWLVLFAPLILLNGRSWLTAALLFGFFAYGCWDFAMRYEFLNRGIDTNWAEFAVATAAPVLVVPFAAFWRNRSNRAAFWTRLEQVALVYAVLGASFTVILAAIEPFSDDGLGLPAQFIRLGIGAVAAALALATRPGISGRMVSAILLAAGVTQPLAFAIAGSDLLAGMLFLGLWTGIAAAALVAGWRGTFQAAVAIIAIRLIILSFELASDLLLSGFGLILSGLLVLGIGYGAVRVSREFAPLADAEGTAA